MDKTTPFKWDLFLSYAGGDKRYARDLCEGLTKVGIAVWFAPQSLYAGEQWKAKILAALKKSEHFLYLIGKEPGPYQLWEHTKFEDLRARRGVRRVMPFKIGDREPRELDARDHLIEATNFTIATLIEHIVADPAVGRRGEADLPAPAPLAPFAIDDYLCLLAEQHRSLEIKGFETTLHAVITMDELYVPLRTGLGYRGGIEEQESGEKGEQRGAKPEGGAEKKDAHHDFVREVPLIDAFETAKRMGRRGVILLGDPGSGKTTHLRRVAYLLATGEAEKLGLPKGSLPIFLPLRKLTNTSRGLEPFIEAEMRSAFSRLPEGFAKGLLARGSIVYLLDGLDEVPPSRRGEVARWIEQGLNTSHDAHFLVSSRIAGYTQAVHFGAKFLELTLSPLNDAEVKLLVERWYRTVETSLDSDRTAALARADARSSSLLSRIHGPEFRGNKSLAEMTGNPLLLSAICLVHRDRARLPERRVELYEECVNVLLKYWRGAKEFEISFDADLARRILQKIAFWLHQKDQRTRASATELQPLIEEALKKAKAADTNAVAFLAAIRDESGLLTGYSETVFGFLHLGFQEYLTACEIRSRCFDEPEVLKQHVAHFGDPWWREVTMLLLALKDPPLFRPFFRNLASSMAFAEHRDLVVACLEEAVAFSPEPFVEVLQFPPAQDRALWARQTVAHWILKSRAPEALVPLAPLLLAHPAPEISGRLRLPAEAKGGAHCTAPELAIARVRGLEFVTIPAGQFLMGSPKTEEGRWDDEGPQHEVTISAFRLARTPVTNTDYAEFLKAKSHRKPEYWKDRAYNQADQPVVGVDWNDAVAYCHWLGAGARLPTEAEWEYACRAGTTTRFWSGNSDSDLDRVGWYAKNSAGRLHPVSEKPASPFGLFDMHGNVWEWCQDWFGGFSGRAAADPAGPSSGSGRVWRGGGFRSGARSCRSAYRSWSDPTYRGNNLGFRVALPSPSR